MLSDSLKNGFFYIIKKAKAKQIGRNVARLLRNRRANYDIELKLNWCSVFPRFHTFPTFFLIHLMLLFLCFPTCTGVKSKLGSSASETIQLWLTLYFLFETPFTFQFLWLPLLKNGKKSCFGFFVWLSDMYASE